MRLEWLEDILAVAETGSLSEAADRRNLTQSAFSRRIRAIEDHVGAPLFDRARKPMQLRPATEAQRDQIAKLAADLRQLSNDLRRGDRESGNRLILASQHALTTSLAPDLLEWIGRKVPDAYVRLRSANQDDCFALLLARQADMALVYRVQGQAHLIEAEYIDSLLLGQDRLIPVYASASAEELNNRYTSGALPIIAYPAEVFLGDIMDRMILPRLRRMTTLSAKAETALTLAALELASIGIGVAWVPSSLARARLQDGTLIELSSTLPSVGLDVTALRITGTSGATQSAVWQRLVSIAQAG